jgi:hypothetical protein
MGKVGVCPITGKTMKQDIDLMSLSEKELRALFKKVDLGDLMPTIEEIEDELEGNVDRYMSLSAAEYRDELDIE